MFLFKKCKEISTEYFFSLTQCFYKTTHKSKNMSSKLHLRTYTKVIKPILQLGISIATFHVTSESFIRRVLINAPLITTILCFVSVMVHIVDSFEGHLTTNLIMSLLFFMASLQIISKTLSMRFHRSDLLELLKKVHLFHNNNNENKELNAIAEENLTKFCNIWISAFK